MKRKPRPYLARKLVSEHELKLFLQVLQAKGWFTCAEISQQAGLKRRIVATHLTRWLDCGLLERVEITPEHRWRLSQQADQVVHFNDLKMTAIRLGWLEHGEALQG